MPRWNMELERTPVGARYLLASWWASELGIIGAGLASFREGSGRRHARLARADWRDSTIRPAGSFEIARDVLRVITARQPDIAVA